MKEEYLAFDIETTPLDWETFSESQQEFLLRNLTTEEEIQKRKSELGLSPFTAQIICIGLYFVELEEGNEINTKSVSYVVDNSYSNDQENIQTIEDTEIHIVNEFKALETFWRILAKHPNVHLISFNGRNFDCPFIMLRSAILGIVPSRNLMAGTKYNYDFHTDLLDELTFYQPTFYFSATKRFNLDFYTRSFGIDSPKSFGLDGSNVSDYYKQGKLIDIALYCIRDVKSTWLLYRKLKNFLFL